VLLTVITLPYITVLKIFGSIRIEVQEIVLRVWNCMGVWGRTVRSSNPWYFKEIWMILKWT